MYVCHLEQWCLAEKPEVKRTVGRSRNRWEDTRMDIKERGLDGVDWILLSQDRDQWRYRVNKVMNLRVP
jgi:hypothetical protein